LPSGSLNFAWAPEPGWRRDPKERPEKPLGPPGSRSEDRLLGRCPRASRALPNSSVPSNHSVPRTISPDQVSWRAFYPKADPRPSSSTPVSVSANRPGPASHGHSFETSRCNRYEYRLHRFPVPEGTRSAPFRFPRRGPGWCCLPLDCLGRSSSYGPPRPRSIRNRD
jgi:hypothetical protein